MLANHYLHSLIAGGLISVAISIARKALTKATIIFKAEITLHWPRDDL